VVMDSPDDRSTANRLLEPFGLGFAAGIPLTGTVRGVAGAELPALEAKSAWAVEGGQVVATIASHEPGAASRPLPVPVIAATSVGRGRVVAVGLATALSDTGDLWVSAWSMSDRPNETPALRAMLNFEFALMRMIVEGRLPAVAPAAATTATASATAPATAAAGAPATATTPASDGAER